MHGVRQMQCRSQLMAQGASELTLDPEVGGSSLTVGAVAF